MFKMSILKVWVPSLSNYKTGEGICIYNYSSYPVQVTIEKPEIVEPEETDEFDYD